MTADDSCRHSRSPDPTSSRTEGRHRRRPTRGWPSRRRPAGAGGPAAAGRAGAARRWSARGRRGGGRGRLTRRTTPAPAAPARGQTLAAGKGILVLVTLYGGNDGLNTVIPYQDSHYLQGRPTWATSPTRSSRWATAWRFTPTSRG